MRRRELGQGEVRSPPSPLSALCLARSLTHTSTYDAGCVLAAPPLFGALAPSLPALVLQNVAHPQVGAIPQLALELVEV